MKKLITLMLGMSLLFGTVSVVFGQDTPPKKSKIIKTEGKKKKKKATEDAPKKEGSRN